MPEFNKKERLMYQRRVRNVLVALLTAVATLIPLAGAASAEVKEVRLSKQYGLSYLPLIVMEERKLIEKHAKKAGLGELKVSWSTFSSGAVMNDALLSGSIDFAAGGVAPLLTIWDKTRGGVKGVSALDSAPMYLNSNNPAVRSIKDLTEKDRIALPAVKVSVQAVTLQLAAAKQFGLKNYDRLDKLTVSMKHPDALVALLGGNSEVTGHLTSPPFMFQELKDPKVHTIMNSFEVLGGPHTTNVVWADRKFYESNPKTYAAVFAALEEAVSIINRDKRAAAELYLKAGNSKESLQEVQGYLTREPLTFTTTPLRVTRFSDFMYQTGVLKSRPREWKDLFFPNVHAKKGS